MRPCPLALLFVGVLVVAWLGLLLPAAAQEKPADGSQTPADLIGSWSGENVQGPRAAKVTITFRADGWQSLSVGRTFLVKASGTVKVDPSSGEVVLEGKYTPDSSLWSNHQLRYILKKSGDDKLVGKGVGPAGEVKTTLTKDK